MRVGAAETHAPFAIGSSAVVSVRELAISNISCSVKARLLVRSRGHTGDCIGLTVEVRSATRVEGEARLILSREGGAVSIKPSRAISGGNALYIRTCTKNATRGADGNSGCRVRSALSNDAGVSTNARSQRRITAILAIDSGTSAKIILSEVVIATGKIAEQWVVETLVSGGKNVVTTGGLCVAASKSRAIDSGALSVRDVIG